MKSVVLVVIILGLFVNVAMAGELQIVTENYPPMNYEKDGKIVGISTDIVRAVLERAGQTADIRLYPWARAYNLVLEGKNVMIYSIARTAERENSFKWIGPLYTIEEGLFKLKSRADVKIESLEDAKAYRTGVIRGYAVHQYLLKEGFEEKRLQLQPVSSQEQNVKKLYANRVDLIVASEFDLLWRFKDSPAYAYDDLESVYVFDTFELYMAFGLKTPDAIIEQLQNSLDALKAEGKIEAVLESHKAEMTK